MLGTLEDLRRLSQFIGTQSPDTISIPESFIINTGRIWPNKTIPYEVSSEFSDSDRKKISNAISCVNETTFLRLIVHTNEKDWVEIVKGDGNSSSIGRAGGKQQIILDSEDGFSAGNAMHELGHTFGLRHEHCRTDRDRFVTVFMEHVISDARSNFEIQQGSLVSGYDYLSIMHYGPYAFSIDDKVTIAPTDPVYWQIIGQRFTYSPEDYYGISSLYTPPVGQTPIVYDVTHEMLNLDKPTNYFESDAGQAIRMAHRWATGQSKGLCSAMPNFEAAASRCGVVVYGRGANVANATYKELKLDKPTDSYDKRAGVAFRAVHDYACSKGRASGFPNFEAWHDDCGVILLDPKIAKVIDVNYKTLGLDKPINDYDTDAGVAIRAAHRYGCGQKGCVTAFPNFHASGDMCGIVLITRPS